jgi:hypothetical protein
VAETRFGTFDDLMAGLENTMYEIAITLRKVILEVDPNAQEVVRLGDRAATYGVGPKKMSEGYVYIIPQLRHVNLGFYRGTSLDDPEGLLEGTGRAMRHVKIRTVEEARRASVRNLISLAVAERQRALA